MIFAHYSILVFTLLASTFAHADTLEECQAKIAEYLGQRPTTLIQGPNGNADYFLSKSKTCGVEFESKLGYFTVTKFKNNQIKKFETILLNENDTTAGGRVKGSVSCDIYGNAVVYTTRLPIFSDGVRTPYQTKTLMIILGDHDLYISLRSEISFLSSTVKCAL